jgi:hypothetical protein
VNGTSSTHKKRFFFKIEFFNTINYNTSKMEREFQEIQFRMFNIVLHIASLNEELDALKIRHNNILDMIKNRVVRPEQIFIITPNIEEVKNDEDLSTSNKDVIDLSTSNKDVIDLSTSNKDVEEKTEDSSTSNKDVEEEEFEVVERKQRKESNKTKEPNKMACWNGTKCPDKDNGCPFNHTMKKEPWEIDCKYGSDCNNMACPFRHEYRPCKFGKNCNRKDECVFDHPDNEPSEDEVVQNNDAW